VLAYAAEAARQCGIKKIIVHSHCTAINSVKHRLVRLIYGRIIKNNATDFWACSFEAGLDKYPKQLANDRLVVIPNGIKIEDFRRDDAKRRAVRKELNLTDEDFVIGHVGRFSYQKNHEMLIQVFKRVKERHKASKLLLVGDGELMQEVKRSVSENDFDNDVIFTGNVDNVADYYQAMDCFAFPSRFEGFGYVALEAEAACIPCVISSEVPNDVAVGHNVEILPLSDMERWADCILNYEDKRVTDNSDAIERAGYDVKRTAEMIRENYYKIEG